MTDPQPPDPPADGHTDDVPPDGYADPDQFPPADDDDGQEG